MKKTVKQIHVHQLIFKSVTRRFSERMERKIKYTVHEHDSDA